MKMQIAFLSLVLVSSLNSLIVRSQNLPPAKYDGFLYSSGRADPDAVLIEAFFDPVCPDSRDAWPPLKQVLDRYGSRVSLILHLLPLPYHDNSYVASRALHIANSLNASSTFPLLERFFRHQDKFYNSRTINLTKAGVVKKVVHFASAAVGNSLESEFEAGFTDSRTDLKTRVSFKFSASRGIYGTPSFLVNGFVLPDIGSPLDFNHWKNIIDPLFATNKDHHFDFMPIF
ncbi:hypothetical protein LINGRAHAP2_LOCUS5263 [Linum grandiflorum]